MSKMNNSTNDWQNDLLEDLPDSPVAVLDEFASKLGPKTEGLVIAEAKRRHVGGGHLLLDMDLRVPALEPYRYKLLSFRQAAATLYPLECMVPGPPESDPLEPFAYLVEENRERLDSASELKQFVGKILSSRQTTEIVKSLIVMAKEESVLAAKA